MQRDFKGIWIPKQIWLDNRLNALDKIILAEIDSLDNSEKGCFASNKHLAEFCQCSETKVSTAISKLIELEYIFVEKFDGRTRILKSRLSNFERQTLKNCKADFKNLKESNIYNKIDINIINNIICFLNEKTGKHYKSSIKKTQSLINARFEEGFTEDDFKKVIEIKCKEWKGTEWEKYLRPETLFGTKFESYLNSNKQNKSSFEIDDIMKRVNNFD